MPLFICSNLTLQHIGTTEVGTIFATYTPTSRPILELWSIYRINSIYRQASSNHPSKIEINETPTSFICIAKIENFIYEQYYNHFVAFDLKLFKKFTSSGARDDG